MAEMNGSGLTMVARLAVLVLATGLAGCMVEAVDEPEEGEAELSLVEGGGEAASVVSAPETADDADSGDGEDLDLPLAYGASSKGEEVSGEPFPDPWDIGAPDPTNAESDGHTHKSKTEF